MDDLSSYLILIAAGTVAALVNVPSGGGSFLTLPVLIFLGLPPGVANGTNRVGVVAQNLGAAVGFHRFQVLDWRWALVVSVPAVIGSALGAWAALQIGDDTFRQILSIFMIIAAVGMLFAPDPEREGAVVHSPTSPLVVAGFFIAGMYGGFLQAGVGLLILVVTTWAGLDLVRGNAVKVLANFLMTGLALVIFASHARVHWPFGIALAAGNLIGGEVGVRLTVLKGHRWVKGVVTITGIAMALRLWFGAGSG